MDDFIRAKRLLSNKLQEIDVDSKISVNREQETFTVILLGGTTPVSKIYAHVPVAFSQERKTEDIIVFSIDWKLFKRYFSKNYTDADIIIQ